MNWDDIQDYVDKAPERKAAAEKRMKDYTENNAKNSAQFKENMSNISKEYDSKMEDLKAKYQPSRSGGGGGGAGIPKVGPKKPTDMKKGGKVSASKRADGCCVKGKTKGRMV